MNAKQAKEIIEWGDKPENLYLPKPDTYIHSGKYYLAHGFLEGYRQGQAERTQAAAPLLESHEKLLKALDEISKGAHHWKDGKQRDGCISFEQCTCAEKRAQEVVSESLQVEREYREKALGE